MKPSFSIYLFKSSSDQLCNLSYAILSNRIKQIIRVFHTQVGGLDGKEINLIITDQKSIERLNKNFRKIRRPTDVLSFVLDSDVWGEIWLCPAVIKENSKIYKQEFEKELLRVTVHGLLHLTGLDHKKDFVLGKENREKMFVLQEKIVEMLY